MYYSDGLLETLLLEGLQSAETELTPADWSEIRQEAIAQVKARQRRDSLGWHCDQPRERS
jgi:hypothetical protein